MKAVSICNTHFNWRWRGMNKVQLETFLAVMKYSSFSEAAKQMNVTQPTITSRIKALEAELSCRLFRRNGHEIVLTNEGNTFLTYAEGILATMKHSKEMIKNITKPMIRIGFSPGYAYSFIVELLHVAQKLESFDVQVVEGYDSLDLNNKLLTGEVDLIFNRYALTNQPGIESEYLFDNNLVLLVGKSHVLSKKRKLTLDDLVGETIISYRRNSGLWEEIDQQLLQVRNLKRIDVDNNEMLKRAIKNNIGIGIIPFLGLDKSDKKEIQVTTADEISAIPNKVYVQHRKNPILEKAVKKITYAIINHKYDDMNDDTEAVSH